MIAKTPQEKRELAKYLEKHDPKTLEFLKTCAEYFGPLDAVKYEKTPG